MKARAAAPSRAPRGPAARRAPPTSSGATSPWARWRWSSPRTTSSQSLSRYRLGRPGPHPAHDPAVQLLPRRRARRRHAEHDAGARARRSRRAAPGLEHGRRPDGDGGLRPHAGRGVLRGQRGRRGRRARRGRRLSDGRPRRSAAVAGGLKFKEAQTSMLVADARSGMQVAAAEGSARRPTSALGGPRSAAAWAARAGSAATATPTKARSSPPASLDNYNGIVRAVRANPSLQRNVGTLAEEAGSEDQGRRRSSTRATSCARRSPT